MNYTLTRCRRSIVFCGVLLCLLLGRFRPAGAVAAVVDLTAVKDNTLIRFDYSSYEPGQADTYMYSNGAGPDFVAGNTGNVHGIQRGLLQFDFSPPAIPSQAVITQVSLQLEVVDVPKRAFETNCFWLVRIEGLAEPWGEGASNKPSSGQANATAGDATWFHTQYQPAEHGYLENPSDPLKDFRTTTAGYWDENKQGYLGDSAINQADYDLADAFGVGYGLSGLGPVTHSTSQMVADVQAWVDGTKENFGWIMVGEEWYDAINPSDGKAGSAKRDFASHDNGNPIFWPRLTVTYLTAPAAPIPEPGSFAIFLVLAFGVAGYLRLNRRRRK